MTPERWRQVNDVFHAALERDGAERDAFLRDATRGDADLLREVQSLITSHAHAQGFLDEPAWGVAADLILDDPPRQRIGGYRIVGELGRGGMGVVYEADDERLGRRVALKALTPEYTSDPIRRERLTREARAAAALSHPAIATIFALEEIDGELFIVSELVRGPTLREELETGAMPLDRLLPTLIDVASALVAAHEHGITHRDLKPENIVRRLDGQVKVLDFGLARMVEGGRDRTRTRLTERGMVLGTPGYMAPEQLAGGPVDARADIFAFGVLVWELSTGEHPFGVDSAALLARMAEMMEGRSAVLSRSLPLPGLDRIARRAMRAHADERYQKATDLLADLRALSTGTVAPAGGDALWWWQFHQAAISGVNAAMPVAAWAARHAAPSPYGSWLFYLTLALATVSVTMRLNLWFISRVHRDILVEQRRRVAPVVTAIDALLAVVLLVAAGIVAGTHDALAAFFLTIALVTVASLVLIEPVTTRAAGIR